MNRTNGTKHSRGVLTDDPEELLAEVDTPLVATTPGAFEVSPLRLAERILERPEWARRCLLVTDDSGKYVELKTLDLATGIWRDREATMLGWLGEIGDILESDAYQLAARHRIDLKIVSSMVRAIRSIKSPKQVDDVCRSFAAAVDRFRALGLEPSIRQCQPADMDKDQRYLGVLNGVVDLHTARRLPAEEAASALVTIYAPVPYDPDQYPAADWFLSHLSLKEREWWLDILGFALRGIAKRLYGCMAPPDAGKTSAINLLRATLGPYVASPTVGALDAKVRHDASGHTPGMFAWLAPVKITIVDEVKERELSAPLVKDLTGGGWFTARDTYKQKVTKRATGTTFMFANDVAGEQPLPQLRTDDPGMKARYRELPFPVIPKEQQDPAMRDEWPYDEQRQAQLLTLLVQRAKMNPTEPTDIPQVQDATAARIRKDSGELGSFAARFVRDGSSVVEFREAWEEWCAANNEPPDADAPGGVRKRDFSRRFSAHIDGLWQPTSLRIDGRKSRGWRGWRLLSLKEVEEITTVQARDALLACFPDDFSVLGQTIGSAIVSTILHRDMEKVELLALRTAYEDGRVLVEQVRDLTERSFHMDIETGKVFDKDGHLRDCSPDLDMRKTRVPIQIRQAILHLSWEALHSQGGVPEWREDKRRRYKELWDWWARRTAMSIVDALIRKLGPEADIRTMVSEAVGMLADEVESSPKEDAYRYDKDDIATAIKYLITYEHYRER